MDGKFKDHALASSTARNGGMHAGNRIWYIYLCYHVHLARLLQWAKKMPYSVTPLKMDMARNCQSLPNNSRYMGPFRKFLHTHNFEFIEYYGYQPLKRGGVLNFLSCMGDKNAG